MLSQYACTQERVSRSHLFMFFVCISYPLVSVRWNPADKSPQNALLTSFGQAPPFLDGRQFMQTRCPQERVVKLASAQDGTPMAIPPGQWAHILLYKESPKPTWYDRVWDVDHVCGIRTDMTPPILSEQPCEVWSVPKRSWSPPPECAIVSVAPHKKRKLFCCFWMSPHADRIRTRPWKKMKETCTAAIVLIPSVHSFESDWPFDDPLTSSGHLRGWNWPMSGRVSKVATGSTIEDEDLEPGALAQTD